MAGPGWSLMLAAAVVATGCGTHAPPPPAEPTTAVQRADPATVDLATKATITQADLGAGWVVTTPASEPGPATTDECGAGTPFAALPPGARRLGEQLKIENTKWFVFSSSAVFPDEAAAKAWVETRKSPAYVDCRRAAIEKEQKATDPRVTVITAATTAEGLGAGGFEAYARYQVQADVGVGPQDANGSFARHTYRVSRTVITLSIDTVSDPADPPTLGTKVSEDVTKALTAVYARIG